MATPIFEDNVILEAIKESCQEKKVSSLCNKLIKKNSYKSGKDCETLCHLAYWLYIYDKAELALTCIQPTHNITYFTDAGVWTFIHAMWGLEIRILREQGEENKALEIAHAIDEQYLAPTPLVDTREKKAAHEKKRRSRFTYESVINGEKIEPHLQSGNLNMANGWRFTSLLSMIGNTETGLFPLLAERKHDIELKIQEYISELKK